MSSTSSTVAEIELAGTPGEMGAQHGEALSAEIRTLAEIRCGVLARQYGDGALESAMTAALSMAAAMSRWTPNVLAETQATAQSAGIPYWKLLLAGAFSDVSDLVGRRLGHPPAAATECTLVTLRSADDGLIILGTWDSHASAVGSLVLCRRRPRQGPETLALTTAGWPMQQGLTGRGVAFAIANLVATKVADGVPYVAALPDACAGRSFEAVCERLIAVPHASARCYVLAAESEQRLIEIVPGGPVGTSTNDLDCHTNHFTNPSTLPFEGRLTESAHSRSRRRAGLAFAHEATSHAPPLSRLHDFVRRPILQLGEGDDDRTGVAFLLRPLARDMYFVVPQPPSDSQEWKALHRAL